MNVQLPDTFAAEQIRAFCVAMVVQTVESTGVGMHSAELIIRKAAVLEAYIHNGYAEAKQ